MNIGRRLNHHASSFYKTSQLERDPNSTSINSLLYKNISYIYSYHPLLILVIVSIAFFIPILIYSKGFDLLKNSAYESSIRSSDQVIVLSCILGTVVPLLFDFTLDFISFKKVEYLMYRFLSLFTIVVSNSVILITMHASYGASLALTIFNWAYFVELSVVLCFLNHLMPTIFTINRIYMLGFGFFVCFITLILNAIPTTSSYALFIIHYSVYAISAMFFNVLIGYFFYTLWLKYTTTTHVRSFNIFMKNLSINEECAITFITGLAIGIMGYILVLVYFDRKAAYIIYLDEISLTIIEIARTFICIITYVLPSRLFREKIQREKTDLESKAEFIKYVSHEIRTPLGAIEISLTLMRKDMENLISESSTCTAHASTTTTDFTRSIKDKIVSDYASNTRDRLVDMSDALETITERMNDLLLYEKIQSQTLELALVPHNPFTLVERIVSNHKKDYLIVQMEEETEYSSNIQCRVDTSKFKLIIDALLSPALKSTNVCGDVVINFEMIRKHPSKSLRRSQAQSVVPIEFVESSILVSITDTRSGMTPTKFEGINTSDLKFDRKGHDDGRELVFALWLATKLLACHSSELAVTSDETGLGIIFKFELKLEWNNQFSREPSENNIQQLKNYSVQVEMNELSESALDNITANDNTTIKATLAQRKPLVVLFIDDSSLMRKLMRQFIQSLNHKYHDADDGETGLIVFQELSHQGIRVDVILMDNQMPVMMGPQATRIIRNDYHFEGVILGVTGNLNKDDVREFLSAGADEVLEKPLKAEVFYASYDRAKEARK